VLNALSHEAEQNTEPEGIANWSIW